MHFESLPRLSLKIGHPGPTIHQPGSGSIQLWGHKKRIMAGRSLFFLSGVPSLTVKPYYNNVAFNGPSTLG